MRRTVSALDVSIQSQIINLLMDLAEGDESYILIYFHDLSVVEHISGQGFHYVPWKDCRNGRLRRNIRKPDASLHRGSFISRACAGSLIINPTGFCLPGTYHPLQMRLRDVISIPGVQKYSATARSFHRSLRVRASIRSGACCIRSLIPIPRPKQRKGNF